MTAFLRLGTVRDVSAFRAHLQTIGLELPCDDEVLSGPASPLSEPVRLDGLTIGNRVAVQPMEGWDGTPDGRPSEATLRRWRRFGQSGAKLIWGGEAVAVRHDGRANPNQLLITPNARDDLSRLREALLDEHRRATGSTDGLVIGLQLTHSGRYSRPNAKDRPEPRILYYHPILDRRLGLGPDHPLLGDGEVRALIDAFVQAARLARAAGFDFVDVKHCHGYLGHEFLSAHCRDGNYGGDFDRRTRFLREVLEGIWAEAPGLAVGVRVSIFDTVPFWPDPARSAPGRPGPGVPEPHQHLLPYRWGFGVDADNPVEPDLEEPVRFLSLLLKLGIRLVNLSAGSPYYNPHVQRPAYYPPSDGYQPPEDPLVGVARQMRVARALKRQFPELVIVGTAYSYLQEFLPHVAQAAVREGWVDVVGLGRMTLAYPEVLWDALAGHQIQHKRLCRTFSDCTTAPRNGLPSGCYPLDAYYKQSEDGARLRAIKAAVAERTA